MINRQIASTTYVQPTCLLHPTRDTKRKIKPSQAKLKLSDYLLKLGPINNNIQHYLILAVFALNIANKSSKHLNQQLSDKWQQCSIQTSQIYFANKNKL